MATGAHQDLARLAKLARARRIEQHIALTDATAKAGGISKKPWQRVEAGEPIREANYTKIDALINWAPGSCKRVLAGGDPVPVTPADADPEAVKAIVRPEMVDAKAREVLQLAAIATLKGATAEEIVAFSERAAEDLRKSGLI
jgi:hypothetical protein